MKHLEILLLQQIGDLNRFLPGSSLLGGWMGGLGEGHALD